LQFKECKLELLSKQSSTDTEKFDDDHFLMSLLPSMKNLNTVQKLWIRNRIQQIILQEMLLHPQPPPFPLPTVSYASTTSSDNSGYFNQSTEYMPSYKDYNNPKLINNADL
jgi:hypothetical protein